MQPLTVGILKLFVLQKLIVTEGSNLQVKQQEAVPHFSGREKNTWIKSSHFFIQFLLNFDAWG